MYAVGPMTEGEWMMCDQAHVLVLDIVLHHSNASARKCRLFVCACARLLWPFLRDPRSRAVVELAERHIEGEVTDEEMRSAGEVAEAAWTAEEDADDALYESDPSGYRRSPYFIASVAAAMASYFGENRFDDWKVPNAMTRHPECHQPARVLALVRDIFGNPFRPIVIDSAWLTWRDDTISLLARTIYDDRRFDLLPVLADALEDAGCTDAAILDHCRDTGPHVRGCWVVDLMLGRT